MVAITSESGAALALEYGASKTVDYKAGDVAAQLRGAFPDGIDALIDLHSDGDALAELGTAVKSGGVTVSPRGPAASASPALEARGVRFAPANRVPASRLPELTELFDAGKLKMPPIKEFPLEQTVAALADMADGHVRGKLVIAVS